VERVFKMLKKKMKDCCHESDSKVEEGLKKKMKSGVWEEDE